ncbi:MAG: hypothetical protein JSU87_15710 [Gemmatimonadota bacterium]|nr:MAG: hypothetical protein JSU87_15710 [Gemmatimonadota bacterium]
MAETTQRSWRRIFNRTVPLGAALVGVVIVLISFLLVADMFWWLVGVACGLAIAILGFAYGGCPFLTSERRYPELRREVDAFIGMVRQLNRAAGAGEEFENAKSAMHKSVERMAELAGKRESK